MEPYFGRFAGSFQDVTGNGISGQIYFVNSHSLFLYNFTYDGQGTGNVDKLNVSQCAGLVKGQWCLSAGEVLLLLQSAAVCRHSD